MMKRKAVLILFILLVTLFPPSIDTPRVEADGEEWLTGWDHRKRIDINGSTAGVQTDYQIPIEVHYDLAYYEFAGNGEDDPFYVNWGPSSVYYNGVTYITWSGIDYDPYIIAYNHSTDTWSNVVKVGTNPLTGDHHGSPTILIDDSGYIHIFFGCHGTALKYSRSTNPENITAWTARANPVTIASYPVAVETENGDIYLFYRTGMAPASFNERYVKSDDGGASWGAETVIIAVDAIGDIIYSYHPVVFDSSNIQIIWRYHDATFGSSENVYHAYLNTTDGNMYSMNGTDLGASVSKAESDANCMVVDTGAFVTCHMMLHLDEANYSNIMYCVTTAGGREFLFTKWNGTGWTTPESITTSDDNDNKFDFKINSENNITAYLVTDGESGAGGDIEKWNWDGVTWSKVLTVMKETYAGRPLSGPRIPVNHNDEIEVVFSEYGGAGVGSLNLYAWGTMPLEDSRTDVYLGRKGKTDFGDIRFTSSDGLSLIDLWEEKQIESNSACFVFEADEIPEYPANGTIYMYYGKSDATNVSDPFATFVDFDDFNNNSLNSGWTEEKASGTETITEENQEIHFYHRANAFDHIEKDMTSNDTVVRVKLKRVNEVPAEVSWGIALVLYFNQYDFASMYLIDQAGNNRQIVANSQKDEVNDAQLSAEGEWTVNNYKYVRMRLTNDTVYYDYSDTGKVWTNLWTADRVATWDNPSLIIIGHGIERSSASYPNADYDNSIGSPGAGFDTYADDYIVRKYVLSEPMIVGWGSEETESAPTNVNPSVTSFVISDLSDGSTVFKTLWYRPIMVVDDSDGLSDIGTSYFAFETDYGWHNVSYNYQTDFYVVDTETGNILVANGYTESSGTSLTIHFYLMLLESIDVDTNVDVYCRVTDASGGDSDWSLEQSDYFNILDYVEDVGGSGSWTPSETPAEEPQEIWIDSDEDGIPNWDDPDIDGDGIPNEYDEDIDGDDIPNNLDPEPFIPEEKEERPILFSFKTPSGKIINIINPMYYLKPYQKIIIPFLFLLLALMLYSIYRSRQKKSLDERVSTKITNLGGKMVKR